MKTLHKTETILTEDIVIRSILHMWTAEITGFVDLPIDEIESADLTYDSNTHQFILNLTFESVD